MSIPYGKQSIDDNDIAAVVSVLASPFLTQGPVVPRFEEKVCQTVSADFGVAANSATSALHIAVKALDLKPGEIVWTSPITFVATANCARYCGATVDFVDIDPGTFNLCPDALAQKLAQAKVQNRLPKIVIAVHMAGQSADMEAIYKLSQTYGFRVIEDASHAIGGSYQNEKIGCCRYSDITVFSFHPVKVITTAEGGMAVTNDKALADKMALFRSHGVTRDQALLADKSQGGWYYEMQDLGFNYRLTDLQAALGISQMDRLSDFVAKRNEIATRYPEIINQDKVIIPEVDSTCLSSFHLYIIQLKDKERRTAAFHMLRERGIGVNVHYIPVHLQPYYRSLGFQKGDYPAAERYYDRAISIPIYPQLTDEEQDLVAAIVNEAVS